MFFMSLALWLVAFVCVFAIVIIVMQAPRGQTRYIPPTPMEPRRKKDTVNITKPGYATAQPGQIPQHVTGYPTAAAQSAQQSPASLAPSQNHAPAVATDVVVAALSDDAPVVKQPLLEFSPQKAAEVSTQPSLLTATQFSAPEPQHYVPTAVTQISSAIVQELAACNPELFATVPAPTKPSQKTTSTSSLSKNQTVPMPARQVFIPTVQPVQQATSQQVVPVSAPVAMAPAPITEPLPKPVNVAAPIVQETTTTPSPEETLQHVTPVPKEMPAKPRAKSTLNHMLNKAMAERR